MLQAQTNMAQTNMAQTNMAQTNMAKTNMALTLNGGIKVTLGQTPTPRKPNERCEDKHGGKALKREGKIRGK